MVMLGMKLRGSLLPFASSSRSICKIAFAESIGEPPPTKMSKLMRESLASLATRSMTSTSACSPI